MNDGSILPLLHVCVRNKRACIPNVALTDTGYNLNIAPVRIADIHAVSLLTEALRQAMESGNPVITAPLRDNFPKPVVLAPAKVRSWNELERTTTCFTIYLKSSGYEVHMTKHGSDGLWLEDPSQTKTFPWDTDVAVIAEHIASCAGKGPRYRDEGTHQTTA